MGGKECPHHFSITVSRATVMGKVYETVERRARRYDSETAAPSVRQEAELEMLTFSLGVSGMEMIKKGCSRETAGVRCLGKEIRGVEPRWFGHMTRTDEDIWMW